MANLLVLHDNNHQVSSFDLFLKELDDWEIQYLSYSDYSLNSISQSIRKKNIFFILVTCEFTESLVEDLLKLRRNHPLLLVIFYNAQLKDQEFSKLYFAGIDYCFIGDTRQFNVIKKLQDLWQKHWRRIPQELLENSDLIYKDRMIVMKKFIETTTLSNLKSAALAKHLNMSESHFRLEFKKYFGLNFRDFKQQLFFRYETCLLFEKNLKPREVFNILNYRNLSAFSRSFKTRHGSSWQYLIRQNTQQYAQDNV